MPAPYYHRGQPATRDEGVDESQAGSQTTEGRPLPPTQLERPKDCVNKFPTPPFALLCTVMDRLRGEEAGKRRDTLKRLFEMWRLKVGNDLYPLFRLLLPDVSISVDP